MERFKEQLEGEKRKIIMDRRKEKNIPKRKEKME